MMARTCRRSLRSTRPCMASRGHAPSIAADSPRHCPPACASAGYSGPQALIRKLTLLKQGADLHTATTNQMVMHRVAVEGYDAQVARARAVYRARRDAMLGALERHAPSGLRWKKPDGGMFIWVALPEHLDTGILLRRALRQDIAFVPGAAFHADGSGHNTLRLSFSLSDEAQIEIGIFKLCGLIGQQSMAKAVNV